MNRVIKDICLLGFGAAIGSVCTWFGVKKYYEAKADMEVESVKNAYTDKVKEFESVKSSIDGAIKGASEIVEEKALETKRSIVEKLNNKPPLTDYTKFFKQAAENAKENISNIRLSEEDAKKLGIEVDEAETEGPQDDEPYTDEEDKLQTLDYIDHQLNGNHNKAVSENLPPFVIDRSEFELGCDHYDKLSLVYYISDDVLCEETGEEINRFDFVGNCLEESGFTQDDEDELFVRNDKLTTDFEVTKVYTRY